MSVSDSAVAPGGTVNLAFDGLFPHRDYCFVLTSADTSANAATSAMVERQSPCQPRRRIGSCNSLDATDTIVARDALMAEDRTAAISSFTEAKLVGLTDFDGDGLEDFVVMNTTIRPMAQ